MTREYLIERLRDFSFSSRRKFHDVIKASVPQSNGQTFLPIVAVVDEPDESGVVWATLHLRRTKVLGSVVDPHAAARTRPQHTLLPRED